MRAATALGRIGEPAVEYLIQLLGDENSMVRSRTAWELGRIGDSRAVEPLIEALKDELGEALLTTEIWSLAGGEVIAGYNPQENVCDLFTQITFYINEALSTTEYPELGKYYILNLAGGKISVTIPVGEYFWAMLIDSKKTPLGFLLKVVLSKLIDSFKEATES